MKRKESPTTIEILEIIDLESHPTVMAKVLAGDIDLGMKFMLEKTGDRYYISGLVFMPADMHKAGIRFFRIASSKEGCIIQKGMILVHIMNNI